MPLIHLIETFDHNAGTTTCGEELDTWTIKYPELSNKEFPALKYGYSNKLNLSLFQTTCDICKNSQEFYEAKQFLLDYMYKEEFKSKYFSEEMINLFKAEQLKMRAEYENFVITHSEIL